jgi:hypothetical protein
LSEDSLDGARSGACPKFDPELEAVLGDPVVGVGAAVPVDLPGFAWATKAEKAPTSATEATAIPRRRRESFQSPASRLAPGDSPCGGGA